MIWVIIALVTTAATGVLAFPLLRRQRAAAARADYDLAVFRDQLTEIDRDVARGVLTTAEAEGARLEIQRRILAAGRGDAERRADETGRSRWIGIGVTAVVIPLLAVGIYAGVGTPDPEAARLAAGGAPPEIEALVERLAARVASEPNNAEGIALLARTYRELGRYQQAADMFRRLVALQPDANAYSSLGEVLAAAANGEVTAEAHAALTQALTLDRDEPRARFYLGAEQAAHSNITNAIAIWRDLVATAPADTPWLNLVHEQIAAAAARANIAPMTIAPRHPLDLLPETGSAATQAPTPAATTPEEAQMIAGMVGRLAARLEQNPGDYDGWMMLGRSYLVLKRNNDAATAYEKAIALKPTELAPKVQYVTAALGHVDADAPGPLPTKLSAVVKDILAAAPEQPEALYAAGLARAKAGDRPGAVELWRRAQSKLAADAPLRAEIARRLNRAE